MNGASFLAANANINAGIDANKTIGKNFIKDFLVRP
jgi:hypothetical protein